MADEHLSQTQIQREADQAIVRARERRKQAEIRRRNRQRASFAVFGLILVIYVLALLILWPR